MLTLLFCGRNIIDVKEKYKMYKMDKWIRNFKLKNTNKYALSF